MKTIKSRREKRNYLNEKSKDSESEPVDLLICKIDTIFMAFDTEPKYFSIIRIFTVIISINLTLILMSFFFTLSLPKNNTYCFDYYSTEFRICDYTKLCSLRPANHINKILYSKYLISCGIWPGSFSSKVLLSACSDFYVDFFIYAPKQAF